MDFVIKTALLDGETAPFDEATQGDTLVCFRPFTYRGYAVPAGTVVTYDGFGNVSVPHGEPHDPLPIYAGSDLLRDFFRKVVPSPEPEQAEAEGFVPDMIDRAEVEKAIREFADEVGYPHYAQRLIDRLPQPEGTFILTVEFAIQAFTEDEARDLLRQALEPTGLPSTTLS
jgi:hypothetical protein